MNKPEKTFWEKHKTLAQIIAILAVVASIYNNYQGVSQNNIAVQDSKSWMIQAIKEQAVEIHKIEVENAALKQEVEDLKNFTIPQKQK